jgi:hypothetical protein
MICVPDAKRYDGSPSRRCGRSGIVLPLMSVGLWQIFGDAFLSTFKHLDQFQKRSR